MDIREERDGSAVVLSMSGRLDATTAKAFEDHILGAIDAGARRLVVDLGGLDYVSSSGLRVLLLAARRLQRTQGRLSLCSPVERVQRVFDLAGFSSVLPIYSSRLDALAAP